MFFYFSAFIILGTFGILFLQYGNADKRNKKDYDKRLDNQLNNCRK